MQQTLPLLSEMIAFAHGSEAKDKGGNEEVRVTDGVGVRAEGDGQGGAIE